MKKIYTLLASVAMVLSLTGCQKPQQQDSSIVDDEEGEDEVAEELVLPANVTRYTLDDTDYASLPEQPTSLIRIFYRRNDTTNDYENYAKWRMWAWDSNGGSGWWREFTKYDAYGVICDIPVSEIAANGTSIAKMGMVITTCQSQTATWTGSYSKDPDCDLFAEINATNPGGIQKVYVKTGTESVYYSQESVFMSTMEYSRFTDFKTVRVIFTSFKADFKLYKKRFTITKNGEPITNYTINDFASKKSGGGYQVSANLVFDQDFSIFDDVVVSYRVAANYTTKASVNLTGIYDSEQFIRDYSYTGNDLGVTFDNVDEPTKTTFKIWCPTAREMKLNIYSSGDYRVEENPAVHVMNRGEKGVWELTVNQDLDGYYYTYTVTNSAGTNEVVDPYAKSAGLNGKRGMIINFERVNRELLGWENDYRVDCKPTEASIYEVHVRDMTINPNSGVSNANRGKYLGLTETGTTYTDPVTEVTVTTGLDHLAELGVSHIQIQPTYDYSSVDEANVPTEMSETNYNWGYDPQNYNALEGSYSSNPADGNTRVIEFKQMIMALHNKGINAIMDVVYNHTSSFGDSNFEKLMPLYYHRTKSSGAAYNGSGCGNEMASERFMVNKFVRESCKFYTEEYHLSGFRFDLMGLMDNRVMIDVYNDCHAIDNQILVFGEPWTGGSTKLKNGTNPEALDNQQTVQGSLAQPYFVGSNVLVGAFSDGFRNSARGDNGPGKGYVQGMAADAPNLLPGFKGLFNANQTNVEPQQVINYVSCHDNYTLYDQLIQSIKDGRDFDMAYKQAETLVFTAQGIPFIQEGEDFMRSKAYEVDGEIKYQGNSYNVGDFVNNMDYALKAEKVDTFNYVKRLIQFRKDEKLLSLSSRAEINEKMTNVQANNGVITFKLADNSEELMVVHSANAANVDLNGEYRVLFTNVSSYTVGQYVTALNLPNNGSAVLLKNA